MPAEKRGVALGAWGGIGGLAVAFGPLVGGAVVDGISWHWIFWLNVPIGLLLAPLARTHLAETYGASRRLDLRGLVLVSMGLFGIVWGLVRGNQVGWASPEITGVLAAGAVLLAAFVLWEQRAEAPMLPLRFFRSRTFTLVNTASLLMFFGMFGSIFLFSQFFQTVQGYSPLHAGLLFLPWTAMPMFFAPIAGARSDRIGGARIMATGLALQAIALAWIAAVTTPTVSYTQLVAPFVLAGVGMAHFFAPVANVVLGSVRPEEDGQASGANNALRELGGVFGVAVLASIFSSNGGYSSGQFFVAGMRPALWIGVAVLAGASLAAHAVPNTRRRSDPLVAVAHARPGFPDRLSGCSAARLAGRRRHRRRALDGSLRAVPARPPARLRPKSATRGIHFGRGHGGMIARDRAPVTRGDEARERS